MQENKHLEIVDILLVEDNKYDAELTLLALEDHGLANNVIWLKDGREALDFLFAEGKFTDRQSSPNPKVVLLDLKMPKIGGLEVLEQIRKDERTKHLPVVVMTSSNQDKDIAKSYDLGVNSFIVKPVDIDQFNKCVREAGFYWAVINKSSEGRNQRRKG